MCPLLDRLRGSALVLLVVSVTAHAAPGGLLDGELGRWLDGQAAPALIEVLDNHPRFRGETLRVVPMRLGQPLGHADALSLALQRALEHRLLQSNGVRIAVTDTVGRCGLKGDIPYLLGIEVDRDGPNRHRVHLAVTDVEEGIWVNGASQTWSGRLTGAQRQALKDTTTTAAPGTLANPLPLDEPAAVAGALDDQLRCQMRALPRTSVQLVSGDPALENVRRELDAHLRGSADLHVVTGPAADAWLLKVGTTANGRQRDVILELEDPTGAHARQRLASVVVTGFGAAPAQVSGSVAGRPWLSALAFETVAPSGVCRRARGADCVEISVDSYESLYLIVFHTHDGAVDVPACGSRAERRAGERRFRFKLTDATGATALADAGFYAIATDNAGIARRLTRQLAEAPGACRSNARTNAQSWLAQLDLLLNQHAESIEWRALHLNRAPGGPVAL